MIDKFEKMIHVGKNETRVVFHLENSKGFNIMQASLIYVVAEKYLQKYPMIKIPLICDDCYIYHGESVNDDNYEYDDQGNELCEKQELARYYWDDHVISFNQVLCKELEDDNMDLLATPECLVTNKIFGDVQQIKQYERADTIKMVLIHEFAHAVEEQLEIYNDDRVKKLYEQCNKEDVFADIHEFIAESFVTNEYYPFNAVSKEIIKVIKSYTN